MNTTLRVFFAFQFSRTLVPKADKETALSAACKEARRELQTPYPGIEIHWQECRLEPGKHVGEQIAEHIRNCDIFIADLTENNPNVLFELGIAYGLRLSDDKRLIWLVHEQTDLTEIPSDMRGIFLERYDHQNLRPTLSSAIRRAAEELASKKIGELREKNLRKFWGLEKGRSVDIVCSEIPPVERPYFADPKDRNYLRYAKFADLDSLIFIKTRIASLFPTTNVRDFSPSEAYDLNTSGLVVVGGPPWNSKYAEFQPHLPCRFIQRPLGQDDPLVFDLPGLKGKEFAPSWAADGSLLRDISIFARTRIRKDLRVFLVAGCLTSGVLGASRAFLDEEVASGNVEYIENHVGDHDFVVAFETERIGGLVRAPDFQSADPLVLAVRDRKSQYRLLSALPSERVA